MNIKRFAGAAVFAFSLLASFAHAASEGLSYPHLLRDKKTECGFYLARLNSEFTGRRVTSDLEPAKLKEALKDFDPKTERLVAVGAPPDWMSRYRLRKEIKAMMEEAGYPETKYTAIRRLSNFIETKVGVFAQIPGQEMRRLSGLNGDELAKSLTGEQLKSILDAGGSIVISGSPLIGPARAKLEAGIREKLENTGAELSPEAVKMRSKFEVWGRAFAENPRKTFLDAWYGVRSLFPYSEDMVRPTEGELRSTGQKVTMHTLFSLVSFALKGEVMQVMVPMTIVNGSNSAATGTYRSFIGNWWSRGGDSMAIRTMKGLMLSSFFTFDLYLARNAFDGHTLKSFAEVSGWTNFLAASWVSILFQAMWRTPVSAVLHHWERWRSEVGGSESSVWARNVAGGAEKFLTYVMTQFYLLSIVVDSSFFKIIWQDHKGLGVLANATDVNSAMGQTLLMNFNVGHLAMAVVGGGALAMKNHYKLFDKVAPKVEWLDKWETRGYRAFTGFFKNAFDVLTRKSKPGA